jgi:hypothetical protein
MLSWLSKALGTNAMKQKFNYDPSQSDYQSGKYENQANWAVQSGKELFSGNSPFLQMARNRLSGSVADSVSAGIGQSNSLLASRGVGSGGMSGALGAILRNKGGETLAQGNADIMGQGFQAGMGLFGQGAGMLGQIDARNLQNQQFNAQNQIDADQFDILGRYNQAAGNRAARGGFANSLLSAASNLWGG